ncbi:LLM class flavin-dependent oxidoreductase [Streptomyces fractus]|uniref:LLM class flavin-dependent oxidoreductase n=1 Tax=Streptomyces fractus TaxID=641806 RepID=UPI003CEF3513
MKIGIGLPNGLADIPGPMIAKWARRAEQRGFESLATTDRLIYPGMDSLVSLSLAGGATSEISLVTNILLAPLYPPAILAKQWGSLAHATGNRITLGLAPGPREDDYIAAGVDYGARGKILDEQAEFLRDAWARRAEGTAICPGPVRIPVLFGGSSAATVRRATTLGDGWVAGALRDYSGQSQFADRIRRAWQSAGRSGHPQMHAAVNFALGDNDVTEAGRQHLGRYYGFIPQYAQLNITDLITSPRDAQETVRAYRDLGFDRLLFHPTVGSLDQVDRLADAVM